jgi:hypothetical protein
MVRRSLHGTLGYTGQKAAHQVLLQLAKEGPNIITQDNVEGVSRNHMEPSGVG